MTKIFSKKFVITDQGYISPQGDRVWCIQPINRCKFTEFYIHTSANSHLYICIPKYKYYSPEKFIPVDILADSIKTICQIIFKETKITPAIRIKPPNPHLFSACLKAGLKHSPLDRTIMIYNP